MDGRILPGPGRVVHHGDVVVVLGDRAPTELIELLFDAASVADGDGLLDRLRQHPHGDEPSLGVLVCHGDGFTVRIGADLLYRSDHVGYRSTVSGPVDLATADPIRVAIGPADMPIGPAADHPGLREGAWLGTGAWVDTGPTVGASPQQLEGVVCGTCAAFVHPRTLRCRRCDTVLEPPRQAWTQPAVPVASLRMDDGTRHVLNGDVVVGRNPSGHERVQSGAAAPLVVTDSERSVSRSHAELLVQGWSVHLRDLGSPNGTSVRLPSSPRHEPVPTGEVIALLPGTEITMGRRAMTLLT